MNYGYNKTLEIGYEAAIERATEILKEEGFGVLTTIDVKETLKKKLDVDFDRYIILGACNPPFAYEALQTDRNIGLLMPCNVIIHEANGKVEVMIFNPMLISQVSENVTLKKLAEKLNDKILKVLEKL